jgi:hypothetical protein
MKHEESEEHPTVERGADMLVLRGLGVWKFVARIRAHGPDGPNGLCAIIPIISRAAPNLAESAESRQEQIANTFATEYKDR